MSDIIKKIRIQFTKRPIPKNGPTSSDAYNSTIDEILADLNSISSSWNADAQPILESLPHGAVDQRWDLPDSLDPFTWGLDGSQVFMDNATDASEDSGRFWYTDATWSRPKTIKEVAYDVFALIDSLREDLEDTRATNTSGLSGEQWQRLGERVRDGWGGSSTGSLDDKITSLTSEVSDFETDVYDGSTMPPATRLTYSFQAMVTRLAELHSGTWQGEDPSTWGHGGDLDILPSAIDHTSNSPIDRGASVDALDDDLNRIRWEIGKLRGNDDYDWDAGFNLPYVATEATLKLHVEAKGTGTQTSTNPHGLALADVDGLGDELGFIRAFIGKGSAGSDMPSYTSDNFIDDGDSLETSISDLDDALYTHINSGDDHTNYYNDDRIESWFTSRIATWLGTKDADDLTEGSSHLFLTTAERSAISANTVARHTHSDLTHIAVRLEYVFTNHTDPDVPIVWTHGKGITFPVVQVVDTSDLDYAGLDIDEVYTYERERGISASGAFVNVQFISSNVLHVYTNATSGVIVAVF